MVVEIGLNALIDLSMGAIIVHLMGKIFGYDVPFYFYPIGAVLAVLPDVDYPYHLFQVVRGKRKFTQTHRMVPHYPVIMIIPICSTLGILGIFYPVFFYWALVALLCLVSHYTHDTIEGIRWLAPWGGNYYRFSVRRGWRKFSIVSWSKNKWEVWIGLLKEKMRRERAGRFETYLNLSAKELATALSLFAIAVLLIFLW